MTAAKEIKYPFSKDFIEKIIEFSGGFLSPEKLDRFFEKLETELSKYYFNRNTESNLLRIIFSQFDKLSFLAECLNYPHHLEIISAISSNSNYLTDIVVRNPEYLSQTFNQSYLDESLSRRNIEKEISESLKKFSSFNAKLNYLRLFKRRIVLKTGLKDILDLNNLQETTEQLSILAKGIISNLFYICHKEIEKKYSLELPKPRYTIIALGKLGGNELNYSSDVDLLILFDKNSLINKEKEYFEILSEATQLFIQSSGEITDKGYIYRVDFRLRPDGRHSPLCRTLNDYLKYYETRGEDWERQMLIKMDFAGGNKKLYRKFQEYLTHFVYPVSFSNSPVMQIKKMKLNIEKRTDDAANIKLFKGGIRDIEFSVQALQLINGGKKKELRNGNTLNTLEILKNLNLISGDEEKFLREAYIFYRKTEHFLQLMNDTQTHSIPGESELLKKLYCFLNFKDTQQFQNKLLQHRKKVRTIYDTLLNSGSSKKEKKDNLDQVLFKDRNKAIKNIAYLKSGLGLLEKKEFDARTIESFEKIEGDLLTFLQRAESPDKILENFVTIIRLSHFPSIWYHEFINRNFFKQFLFICEYSQRGIDLIQHDKTLLDFLLSRKIYTKTLSIDSLNITQIIFLLSTQFTLGLIEFEKLSKILSDAVISQLVKSADSVNPNCNYFIAALGSLGSNEMTFSSDADLIVVAENIKNEPSIQNIFQKFHNEAKRNLRHFQVDFRLRPEGKSSPLVWDIKAYEDYLGDRARVWEFQSLLKSKFVCGNRTLYTKFIKAVLNKLERFDSTELKSQILGMYSQKQKQTISGLTDSFNTKKSAGSILAIESILDLFILSDKKHFKNCLGKNINQKINYINKANGEEKSTNQLKENYYFLRKLHVSIQTIFKTNNSNVPVDEEKRNLLAEFLKLDDAKELSRMLNEVVKSNNQIMLKHFK